MKICRVCGSTCEGNEKVCQNCGIPFISGDNVDGNHKIKRKKNRNEKKKIKFAKNQALYLSLIVFILLIVAVIIVAFKMIFKVCSPLNEIGDEVKNCEEIFEDFFHEDDADQIIDSLYEEDKSGNEMKSLDL